jgi:SAM-dependent methyltransferase
MTLSMEKWHQRYQQQSRWTRALREYVYGRVGIQSANKILDVGCGTGVLLDELRSISSCSIFGLDIDINSLILAHNLVPKSISTLGDALYLPYLARSFDICLCHFVLLWISDPLQVIQEMLRVTQLGGYVLALAEPDYGGRIDFPEELAQVGEWQIEALREQGADPFIGRKLRSLFSTAGLNSIEVGVLGGQWGEDPMAENIELEWEVLKSDLSCKNEFIASAVKLKDLDLTSRRAHHRILYVPTFYAIGVVMS